MNQTEEDYLIYDADDKVVTAYLNDHPVQSTLLPFSLTQTMDQGAFLEDNNIKIIIDNSEIVMPTKNLALEGKHNIKNAMAASTVANLFKKSGSTRSGKASKIFRAPNIAWSMCFVLTRYSI